MHVRRAVVLFVMVLGVAALAAALSRPGRNGSRSGAQTEPLTDLVPAPQPSGTARAGLSFSDRGRPRHRQLPEGEAATVTVSVGEPGQVELLGLTAAAEPLTPARFDLLTRRPGRYTVRFTPAGHQGARAIGVLRVVRSPA